MAGEWAVGEAMHQARARGTFQREASVSESEGDGMARGQAGGVRWDSQGEKAFTFEERASTQRA